MFERVVGKRSDHISSKREENVSPWKQEKCFFFLCGRAGTGTLCSYDHTYCFFSQHRGKCSFLSALQQQPSVHEGRWGLAVLCRVLQKIEILSIQRENSAICSQVNATWLLTLKLYCQVIKTNKSIRFKITHLFSFLKGTRLSLGTL